MSNVNFSSLTAEISICEPLVSDTLSIIDTEGINAYLLRHKNSVPLIELFPVYDESGQWDETALAVEHVRFVPCDQFYFILLALPQDKIGFRGKEERMGVGKGI